MRLESHDFSCPCWAVCSYWWICLYLFQPDLIFLGLERSKCHGGHSLFLFPCGSRYCCNEYLPKTLWICSDFGCEYAVATANLYWMLPSTDVVLGWSLSYLWFLCIGLCSWWRMWCSGVATQALQKWSPNIGIFHGKCSKPGWSEC